MDNLDNTPLVKRLLENELFSKRYFQENSSKYKYSYVRRYSWNSFKYILNEINKLKINKDVINKFENGLKSFELAADRKTNLSTDTEKRIDRLFHGRKDFVIYLNSERILRRDLLMRLNNLWKDELKTLLITSMLGKIPGNDVELKNQLAMSKDKKMIYKLTKIIKRLRINDDLITFETIKSIAKDLKYSYRMKFHQSKLLRQKILAKTDLSIILYYLRNLLLPSKATYSWRKRLAYKIRILNQEDRSKISNKKRAFLVSLLDRNEDLYRFVRFADSAKCCFSSNRKDFIESYKAQGYPENSHPIFSNIKMVTSTFKDIILIPSSVIMNIKKAWYVFRKMKLSPIKCVAIINKDPMSFVMDITDLESEQIVGFVLGRIALNTVSQKPIILVNGVYSSIKSLDLLKKILKVAEASIAVRIGAEGIAVPTHENNFGFPKKYKVTKLQLEALTAVNSNIGKPIKYISDDFGIVANGRFDFEGYYGSLKGIAV